MGLFAKIMSSKIPLFLSFLVWGFMAFLLINLSFYNQPSITDDFCFGWMGRDFGIFHGAYLYYAGWSGRYFADLLLHFNPLVFSTSFEHFKWGTIVLIFLGFANGYYFLKNTLQLTHNNPNLWVLSFISQAVCWYTIPGLFQLFFWFTGHYYYLSFHLVVLFINVYFYCKRASLKIFLLSLIIFSLVGTSEITMIMFSGIFWPYQIYTAWKQKRVKLETIIFLIVWGISVGLVLFSPGNKIRAAKNIDYINGLTESILNFGMLLKIHLKSPLMWIFNLLLFFTIEKPKKQFLLSLTEFGGLLLVFFLSYFLAIVPMALALGEEFIPDRIQSLISMYLILGSGFIVLWFKYRLAPLNPLTQILFQSTLLIAFITLLFFNKNATQFFEEWRFDKAKNYAVENAHRFNLILKSNHQHVTIPAIKNKNTLFFMEELSADPKHLWCKCIANYYGKADIHLLK
jgi:hypothetical protein